MASNEIEFTTLIDLTVDDLAARGVGRRGLRPLMYRIAWGLGINVPPPLFQPWGHVFWIVVVPVTALMLIAKYLLSSTISVAVCLIVGMAMAAALATYYQRKREALGLPEWGAYTRELIANHHASQAKDARKKAAKKRRRRGK